MPVPKRCRTSRPSRTPSNGGAAWSRPTAITNGRTRAGANAPIIYRRDGQPVGFAALAETWMGPNGEEVDTVALVTAPASADLASLHHRVPVTIAPGDFERWLDCRADEADTVRPLLTGPEAG